MWLKSWKSWIVNNRSKIIYITTTIVAMVFGYLLKTFYPAIKDPTVMKYLHLPGTIVMRIFQLLIVPMIVTSLASSISTSTSGGSRKLMIMTFALFITFSSLSPILGTSLMFIMRPGVQTAEELADWQSNTNRPFNPYAAMIKQGMVSKEDTLYDFIINLFPNNIVGAMFMQTYTGLEAKDPNNITLGYKPVIKNQFTVNFMGLCVFATMLGVAILCLGDQVPGARQFLHETQLIILKIIQLLMKLIPMALVYWMVLAGIQFRIPDRLISQLVWFSITTMIGFSILLFIIHSGVYLIFVRKNPVKFFIDLMPVIIVAFGTDSSAVTLPVTIKTMEDNVKLPERVTRFVLPLGVNVHMNGMAMYYPMVVLFVAQMHLVDVGVQHMIVLIFMTLVMSVAIPAIGSGGAVIIIFASFCAALGIENPLDVLVYVSVGDLLVGRIRTCANVLGDCFVAAIVAKYYADDNPKLETIV